MKDMNIQTGFIEADCEALLASGQFVYAEVFTITPNYGAVLRYTNAASDVDVVPMVGGPGRQTYLSRIVVISGLRFKSNIGVEVDEQTVELAYTDGNTFQNAITWSQALRLGRLDGATIRRDRYFSNAWGAPWVFGITMFSGRVSTCTKVGRQSATVNVKSDMVLLSVRMPKDLWQPQCKNTWGDGAGCDLVQGDFNVNTVVGAAPTRSIIPWAGITDEFVMGKLFIEGGDSVTRIRTILKVQVGVHAEIIYPLDFLPLAGQNVSFYPNCRREFARCDLYHAAPEEKYIGFPFVPVAETAV